MLTISSARASALSAAGTQNNPIVAWNNLVSSAVAITSNRSTQADGALSNASSGTTYDYWMPVTSGSSGTITYQVQLPSAQSANVVALIGHDIATIGATQVTLQSSADGVSWSSTLATITAANMGGVCDAAWTTDQTARAWWRVNIEGVPALAYPTVAGVFIGSALQIPSRVYQGLAPVISDTEVDLQSNVSAGGNLLGSSVVRRGATMTLPIEHLADTFIRGASWLSFQQSYNEGSPFIFAWRPTAYPGDLYYGWRDGSPIVPQNSGPRAFMSVQISARIYRG